MKTLSRRTFLRGTGTAMALPLLDMMVQEAHSSEQVSPPTRVAFFYIPNGVVQEFWQPKNAGHNFQLSPTLQPLESVRHKISMFSNLDRVKVPGTDGHAQASTCWLSSAAPDELSPAGYPLKKTIDQIIATETGKHTAFRSLELSCNPYEDNRESVYFDNISWYAHGHVARSMRDPQEVFDRLFGVKNKAAYNSVLDLVLDDAKSLNRTLGKRDREKLAEYMQSVRTVEQQIQRATARQSEFDSLELNRPTKPWQVMRRDEFIQVMGDLMIIALRTDLTRVATLMTAPERWGSPLTVHGLYDKPVDHHGMTHGQGNQAVREKLKELDRYHVEQFATLVQKMDAISEGEGTLLDNMMFTLGSGLSSGALHVYTDLPTIIAGSAGGKLPTNRRDEHPVGTPVANLWLAMARTMGIQVDRIGDSTEPLRGFSIS